jgi:hypothetical protein
LSLIALHTPLLRPLHGGGCCLGGGLGAKPIFYCVVCTLDHAIASLDLDTGTSGLAKAYIGVSVEDDMVAPPNDHPLASAIGLQRR